MHEIAVLDQAVKVVEGIAAEKSISNIRYMTLSVGELTGYLPVFFQKYYPVVTEGKPVFSGSELRIETVKGEALCNQCHALYNVLQNEGCCPKCGSRSKTVLGGQEFLVKDIGV